MQDLGFEYAMIMWSLAVSTELQSENLFVHKNCLTAMNSDRHNNTMFSGKLKKGFSYHTHKSK